MSVRYLHSIDLENYRRIIIKLNKIKVNCNTAFNYIFLILFALITISAITIVCKNILVIIFTALTLLMFICISSYFYTNKKLPSEKQVNKAVVIMLLIMFILQLTAGFFLMSHPITDWGVIDKIAHNYAESGNFDNGYKCRLYTSASPREAHESRLPSCA